MIKTAGKGLWTGPKVAAPCGMGLSVCARAYTQKVPETLISLLSRSIVRAPVNVSSLSATWITQYVSHYPFRSQSDRPPAHEAHLMPYDGISALILV